MQNIVQEVEGAIGSAEAGAKKIETEVKSEIEKADLDLARMLGRLSVHVQGTLHACTEAVIKEASTVKTDVESSRLVQELECVFRPS